MIQPLAALVVTGETCKRLLERDEPPLDKISAAGAVMFGNAYRMAEIIRRLRSLSMNGDIQREKLNLNEIIERALALVEAEARLNGVSLQLDLSPDPPPVPGDSVLSHRSSPMF